MATIDSVACDWQRNAVCYPKPQIYLKGLLSNKGSPCLQAKAHEAKTLLGWVVDVLLRQGAARFPDETAKKGYAGQALLANGSGQLKIFHVRDREPRKVHNGALEYLDILNTRFVQAWGSAGGHITMTWHILARHLATQMSWARARAWSRNYADETENVYMRWQGASIHRRHHAKRVRKQWHVQFMSRRPH